MQVETYKSFEVETSEGFELNTKDFGVKNPALIFDILCNRMYQNPVRTMVQEYMSNARDAHREIGKDDVPIEVTLPTYIDSTLRIRDFGPGLTPERIDEVFVFLGESTKRADDTQTGGFGVGAKVGWAYSDSFSIVSIVDGIKRTYLAFMGPENIGKLSLTDTVGTDEDNGVEIQITIKDIDFSKVRNSVQHVCFFWDVFPVIYNATDKVVAYDGIRNEPVLVDIPNCSEKAMAVVDGIPYPLDATSAKQLNKIIVPYGSYLTACLFFNTGEIDLAVNREGLRYSDKTITSIAMSIDAVAESMEQRLEYVNELSLIKDKIYAFERIFKGILTQKEISIQLSEKDADTKIYLTATYLNTKLVIRSASTQPNDVVYAYGSYTLDENTRIKSGVSCKRNTQQYGVGTRLSIKMSNSMNYCVFLGDTAPSKAKIRTIFNKNKIHCIRAITTTDEVLYKRLIALGFIDLNSVKKTIVKRAALTFNDCDVKSIFDRKITKPIADLDPKKHSYCMFKEITRMRNIVNRCAISIRKCDIYYVTQEQKDFIDTINIPHALEQFTRIYYKECSELQYMFDKKYAGSLYMPYDCPGNIKPLVTELCNVKDIRFKKTYDSIVQYSLYRHVLERADTLSYLADKLGFRKNRLVIAKQKEYKQLSQVVINNVRDIYEQYPLLSSVSSYSLSDEILDDIRIYINAKNGYC